MQMESSYIDLFQNEINRYSEKYKINKWLLKSVLQLEQLNRGSFLLSVYERILCYIFPAIAIKKDLSIGLAQLKISTAVQVLEKNPQSILKKLFDPEFNIRVCAKYLKTIEKEYVIMIPQIIRDEIDIYKYIACRYLGFDTETNHKTVDLYAAIMRSYDGGELSIKIQEEYI